MKYQSVINMKLASHDSMTYLKPKKWYLYPFRFMARCQSKPIEEQYNKYGIRIFDLRISFDKNGIPEFRHGLIAYKGNVEEILNYLNSKADTSVRIILEEYRNDKTDLQENLFKLFIESWKIKYPNIKFFGGFRKRDWFPLVNFEYNPIYEDKYSSNNKNGTTGVIWDDLWPWIYAEFHNRKNIKNGTDKEFLMIDFVNIQ